MSRTETLTLGSAFGLANVNGLYMLGYAWLFGMCEYTYSSVW